MKESLIELVERPPLYHKIISGQEISLLEKRVESTSQVVNYKWFQTFKNKEN